MSKKRVAIIVLISFSIWLASIVWGYVDYETNDDMAMNLIAAGAYGDGSRFLVHCDYLIGLLINVLYSIMPGINCYLWMYLVLNLIAVTVICLILSNSMDCIHSAIVTLAINCLLMYDFYLKIQYTKNAMLYTVVGMMVLTSQLIEKDKIDLGDGILGSIFIMLGFGVRRNSFMLALPFGIGFIITYLLYQTICKKQLRHIKPSNCLIVMLPILLCITSAVTNWFLCKGKPDWSEYYKIDSILTESRDYNQYFFDDSPEEYLAVGITEVDFEMIKNWDWNDPEIFGLEKLEALSLVGEKYRTNKVEISKENLLNNSNAICTTMIGRGIPAILGVLIILSLFSDNITKLIVGEMSVITAIEYFYLVCRGRAPWRAVICIWMPAILFSLYAICRYYKYVLPEHHKLKHNEQETNEGRTRFGIILTVCQFALVIICVLSWLYYQYTFEKNKSLTVEDNYGYGLAIAMNQTDAFFVVDIGNAGTLLGARNIFDVNRSYEGWYSNSTFLGSWLIPTPTAVKSYQNQGIENPIKDLIQENVYCVADDYEIDLLHRFLCEHYQYKLTEEKVTINGIEAWKFSIIE